MDGFECMAPANDSLVKFDDGETSTVKQNSIYIVKLVDGHDEER